MGLFPKRNPQPPTPPQGAPSQEAPRVPPPISRSSASGISQQPLVPRPVPQEVFQRSPAMPRIDKANFAPRPSNAKSFSTTDLEAFLMEAIRLGASDLHLTRNTQPIIRLDGKLVPLDAPVLTPEACERIVLNILTPEQRKRFEDEWELDLSVELHNVGRFRVNIHRQRGTLEAAFRVVNDQIKPIAKLGLPPVVEELGRRNNGLIIVTGPTGSGKTSTLAAIVDQINNEREAMIITVEDPIEYIHSNKRSVVKQREVTSDTHGFVQALRHVLRQDPDVIVIGEMRDLETIQTSLIAAETGHMVFSTLHTPDAIQTVDRIIDVFPPHHQAQVRIQLANTLQAVIAQQLIPIPGNQGRVVAVEILVANPAVRKTIRTGKTEQLTTILQTSYDQGMITMDKSLKLLYLQGLIGFDDAISRCKYPESFDQL